MRIIYSNEEYCEMLIIYGECNRNASEAAREYGARFPNRNHPNKNVFLNLVNRARTTGKLTCDKSAGAPRTARNVANEEAVLAAIEEDGTRSIRTVSRMLNLSLSTTQRILADNKKHPFHYTRVQHLMPQDYPARMNFCRWIINRYEEDENFLRNILFTDESCFARQGTFNSHNYHIWADEDENPHAIFQRGFQERFTVNMWAGIFGNVLVGPFEFPGTLNGEMYANFLRQRLPELLDDIPLANFGRREWFQHDGAPPHYARQAREILDLRYPNCWIGRGGPVNWPRRSPDLTPLDYFLWGHIKNVVYRTEIENVDELRQRILDAFGSVTQDMIRRAQESLLRRARLCLEMQGGHFEHLL